MVYIVHILIIYMYLVDNVDVNYTGANFYSHEKWNHKHMGTTLIEITKI